MAFAAVLTLLCRVRTIPAAFLTSSFGTWRSRTTGGWIRWGGTALIQAKARKREQAIVILILASASCNC